MSFGVLRVLNDDEVSAGMGFSKHGHSNMEIISIPLEGDLEHKDSMGNTTVIKQGDIQAMSAGTGVQHSEKNKNRDKQVKFLQIWIIPNKQNVEPKYDHITLDSETLKNRFQQILSPNSDDYGVWIHQDAWFHLGEFETDQNIEYSLKTPSNGAYIFILEGECTVQDQKLEKRDGLGIWEANVINFSIAKDMTKILLMEVPMAN